MDARSAFSLTHASLHAVLPWMSSSKNSGPRSTRILLGRKRRKRGGGGDDANTSVKIPPSSPQCRDSGRCSCLCLSGPIISRCIERLYMLCQRCSTLSFEVLFSFKQAARPLSVSSPSCINDYINRVSWALKPPPPHFSEFCSLSHLLLRPLPCNNPSLPPHGALLSTLPPSLLSSTVGDLQGTFLSL